MSAETVRPLAAGDLERAAQRDAVEQVILVDDQDQATGTAAKLEVHKLGQLHRAFSILVFNTEGDLLLQRRADNKYHFATRWSNTCCSHPRPGESTAMAAGRRLREEFGIRVPLTEHDEMIYRAEDPESGLIEHEYLHIFHGVYTGEPHPDPTEIGAWRWMAPAAIRRAIASHPSWFTPWFRLLVGRLLPG